VGVAVVPRAGTNVTEHGIADFVIAKTASFKKPQRVSLLSPPYSSRCRPY
jgi:hypothetical protein